MFSRRRLVAGTDATCQAAEPRSNQEAAAEGRGDPARLDPRQRRRESRRREEGIPSGAVREPGAEPEEAAEGGGTYIHTYVYVLASTLGARRALSRVYPARKSDGARD